MCSRDGECNLDGLVGVVYLSFEIVNGLARDELRESSDLAHLAQTSSGIAPNSMISTRMPSEARSSKQLLGKMSLDRTMIRQVARPELRIY